MAVQLTAIGQVLSLTISGPPRPTRSKLTGGAQPPGEALGLAVADLRVLRGNRVIELL